MASSQCSPTCTSFKNLCTTDFGTHNVNFTWMIKDFDFHAAKGKNLTSSTFSAITNDKYKWHLRLDPNGRQDSTTKNNVSLYLYVTFTENLQPVFAKCILDFLNQKEKKVFSDTLTMQEYTPTVNAWGRPDFRKEDILVDNKLTIRCRITFSEKNTVATNLTLRYKSETPKCNLLENLALLLENGELSDFIISVKNKEYPVHKCILAAQSPVFAAMFRHDTRENQLNRMSIEDTDENVIDAMLKYIYTGKCENLDSLVEGLLAAADKYAIDRLKIICSRKLQESLSVENAANILLLSERHHVSELKEEAIRFILGKSGEVLRTAGWENMLSNPQLINEVLCRAVALQ